jgi:hypothetical protein
MRRPSKSGRGTVPITEAEADQIVARIRDAVRPGE